MTKNIKRDGIVFSEIEIAKIMLHFSQRLLDKLSMNKKLYILEPSVGDGSLVLELIKYLPENIEIVIDCLDIHKDFLNNTKKNLPKKKNITINFINEDYLNYISKNNYDLIISNPPYVKTATIGAQKSQELKKQFNLSGKIDLYHAFFVKMINELKENGILIIITSNKYLYNKSGMSLKKNILENLSIEYIIDLGDTKLFNAAVLPAILIANKQKETPNFNKFISIYETNTSENPIFPNVYTYLKNSNSNLFNYNNKTFECKRGNIEINNNDISLIDEIDKIFIKKIHNSSQFFLKDIAKIKVGIKTTADKVFIQNKQFKDIEEDIIHPIIVSKSINKWNISKESLKSIIYPYNYAKDKKEVINLNNYPKCKKFFELNKEILQNRTYVMESNKEWFEIWVAHFPSIWKKEKIVFKDISEKGIFAYDKGSIVNGDSFFILLNDDVDKNYIFFLLGILNSNLLHKYHEIMFPNKLYSNKKRFNSQYLEKYPIPDIKNIYSKEIIENVKQLIFEKYDKEIENNINSLCEKLYDI